MVSRLARLSGGIASEVFAATLEVAGRQERVVVRRYGLGRGVGPGPPTIGRELATLEQLEATRVPAPRVLAADPTGERAGAPALVMTRLPGRIELRPNDLPRWTATLAETLVEVHALDLVAPPYEPWLDLASLRVPPWTRRPGVWEAAIQLLAASPGPEAHGFVHGDYQHFNVLWRGGTLTAVLDWTGSWRGPLDVDVAHARLNLACLFDAGVAESFRLAYESHAGRPTSVWRDVAELAGYVPRFADTLRHQIGRRAPLDVTGMNERVDDLLARSLARR